MSSITAHNAAQNNQYSLLRSLISQDPNLVNSVDVDQRTPLHWAASSGSVDIARYLIDQKADVNLIDSSGWTPLHIAASAGQLEVVQELIGAGADVSRKNDKGITPLHYAASKSHIDIGKLLISRGADVWNIFRYAAGKKYPKLTHIQINARDNANQVPLHRAATTGSVGFIRLLVESQKPSGPKVRLNPADRIGNTPLHLAMESAHAEAAVILINAGADRNRANLEDEVPEEVEGVGGTEQKRARQHVIESCGKR